MQEQRITRRLLTYWDGVRKSQQIPDILRFNSAAIEDVWPYCLRILVDARHKKSVFNYEYMGEPIARLYGRDLTGLIVDQTTRQFPGKVIHHKFEQVLHEKTPMSDAGHFINEEGRMIKYRACILPFGTPKKGVTHIVVGLSCRVF